MLAADSEERAPVTTVSQRPAVALSTLDQGLSVLEYLAQHGPSSQAEIKEHLGVSRATAFRVIAALQGRGYVEHIPAEHKYRLGPALLDLTKNAELSSVVEQATIAMAGLRHATGETVNLGLLRQGRIAYAAIFEGRHALRMQATVGDEVPPHATALGKAVLAALPEPERAALLGPEPYARFTPNTIVSASQLQGELARVAVQGYALDQQEVELGAECIAAAILGSNGRPIGGISVSAVAARMPKGAARRELGQSIAGWCAKISSELA
jgi:IclR family acetate operon transcriptional repressor